MCASPFMLKSHESMRRRPDKRFHMHRQNNNNPGNIYTHCTLTSPQHTIHIHIPDKQTVSPQELDILSTEFVIFIFFFFPFSDFVVVSLVVLECLHWYQTLTSPDSWVSYSTCSFRGPDNTSGCLSRHLSRTANDIGFLSWKTTSKGNRSTGTRSQRVSVSTMSLSPRSKVLDTLWTYASHSSPTVFLLYIPLFLGIPTHLDCQSLKRKWKLFQREDWRLIQQVID